MTVEVIMHGVMHGSIAAVTRHPPGQPPGINWSFWPGVGNRKSSEKPMRGCTQRGVGRGR